MSDFQLWLNQPVWINNTKCKRREYIPYFADELTAFMKRVGYVMDPSWRSGHRIVARWMYTIHRDESRAQYNKDISYPSPLHRDWQEDYDEFQHIMDNSIISDFMEKWKLYEDFDPETRLGQRMYEFQYLVYPYLDLENSKNGRRIAHLLEDTDSDNDSVKSGRKGGMPRGLDIYIAEAQEGLHGGRGFKV